jgi:hypothetical protein
MWRHVRVVAGRRLQDRGEALERFEQHAVGVLGRLGSEHARARELAVIAAREPVQGPPRLRAYLQGGASVRQAAQVRVDLIAAYRNVAAAGMIGL